MSKMSLKALPVLALLLVLPVLVFVAQNGQQLISKATKTPANIVVQSNVVTGPLPHTWKAFAQGGEERGVSMLDNVIVPVSQLQPRYIRLDHIYDFYDVVSRTESGVLQYNWILLDRVVCDILKTGAQPFLSLGYMPPALSKDGSLVSAPVRWTEWQELVQKTIEQYSGVGRRVCQNGENLLLSDVYYEVWNEPDLETFGKWTIYSGERDYKLLYYYASEGAKRAVNTNTFFFGGPVTTRPYQNWMQLFLKYAAAYNMRVDFLSWHHYSAKADDFREDMVKVDKWLSGREFSLYRNLPRVISEWGYDSNPNPVADSSIGAAHAVATIRNLIEEDLEMAFAFEIKDGINPSWGILSRDGIKKPRYVGFELLNVLGSKRVAVSGEGSTVKALASREFQTVSLVLVNYDQQNASEEIVPVTITGLNPSVRYEITQRDLSGREEKVVLFSTQSGTLSRLLRMMPDTAFSLEIKPL